MNPFSRFLRQWNRQPELDVFVEEWDKLEALVVGVYKGDTVTAADQALFESTWPRLRLQYPKLAPALAPLWHDKLVGGVRAPQDPFLRLIDVDSAHAFLSDWEALQYLPAAREALNQLILQRES